MDDLIEALMIFRKYGNPSCPTQCVHDELIVCISPDPVSSKDIIRLDELGFFVNYEYDCFQSFRFGSA